MARKSSVYLTDDMAARLDASGVPLSEVIRRGLDAGEPHPVEVIIRRVIREELTGLRALPAAGDIGCSHQITKGLCEACALTLGRWLNGEDLHPDAHRRQPR